MVFDFYPWKIDVDIEKTRNDNIKTFIRRMIILPIKNGIKCLWTY